MVKYKCLLSTFYSRNLIKHNENKDLFQSLTKIFEGRVKKFLSYVFIHIKNILASIRVSRHRSYQIYNSSGFGISKPLSNLKIVELHGVTYREHRNINCAWKP